MLLLAGALGCAFPNHRHDLRIRDPIPTDPAGFSLVLEQSTGGPMEAGNQVELVENGKVFDVLVEEILKAEHSLNLAPFIWRNSAPSDRLVTAVLDRLRQGVRCRILIDPFWSLDFNQVAHTLGNAGCEIREYRPIRANLGKRILLRTHRRAMVIDGKVGITGGFGVWKSWEGEGLKKEEWRDSNLLVRGPVVRQLQMSFADNWQEAGGALLPASDFPPLEPKGEIRAGLVSSDANLNMSDAERMTLLMIASAQKRLWIANAYFIPSTAMGDMLIEKAKAGVDVRILCPGPVHDVPPVRAAQRSTYERLLVGGVRIYEYQPSMMHAKTMVVDDRYTVVGSTNLDPLSAKWLEETSMVVDDPALTAQLSTSLEADFTHSLEIRWAWWRKRGLIERLAMALTPLVGEFL